MAVDEKAWDDDGFVFGLEGSGLERPKGRTSQVVVDGDSLETTNTQRAIVGGTMAAHAGFAAVALSQMLDLNGGNVPVTAAEAVALAVSSWTCQD